MEKISVCIIDNNIHYRDTLVRYMQSYCKDYVIKLVDLNAIHRETTKSHDVIIVDFGLLDKIKTELDICENKFIVLTSEKKHLNNEIGYFLFYRYSSVLELINHIDKCNKNNSNECRAALGGARLIVCFGLSGGAGTTSIATCVASQLSRNRESRVFFVSLDTFESEAVASGNKSQEKILYHLIKSDFENDNDTIVSNLIETADDVWRLPVSGHMNLIGELDLNDKKKYIDKILRGRRFDYVVVDAGNNHDVFTKYLLESAHNIIINDKCDSCKSHYLKRFEEYLNNITENECRIITTLNFVNTSASNSQQKSIPIRACTKIDNEKLCCSMEFNTDIIRITERIG